MEIYVVDAFSKEISGGNRAGVAIIGEGEEFPEKETMLKIASDFNYSETAFIKKIGRESYETRYFTPVSEVDICGHATIGAFSVLLNKGLIEKEKTYKNITKAGSLDIELEEDTIFMDMGKPESFYKFQDEEEIKKIYKIMGITYEKQGEHKDAYIFPQIISTGLLDIMLPVRDEEQLNAIAPDFELLSKISEECKVVGVHAFTLNTEDGSIKCRNFAPLYGIPEEAATGTSNGALTYYLYLNNIIEVGSVNRFVQGEGMGRPSEIISKLISPEKIKIGGSAVLVKGI